MNCRARSLQKPSRFFHRALSTGNRPLFVQVARSSWSSLVQVTLSSIVDEPNEVHAMFLSAVPNCLLLFKKHYLRALGMALGMALAVVVASWATLPLFAQVTTTEAEQLSPIVSSGRTIVQNMRQFGNWSNSNQILWIDNRPGHRLELTFQSPVAQRVPLTVVMTRAADFGDVVIGMNGRQLATFSGYGRSVTRHEVPLGIVDLKAGANSIVFNLAGKQRGSTGYRVGIDCIVVQNDSRPPSPPTQGKRPTPQRFPGPIARPGPIERVPSPDYPSRPNTLPTIPSSPSDSGWNSKSTNPSDLSVTLPGGADLHVESKGFVFRTPQHLRTGQYVVQVTYDVSAVPHANGALLQIVRGGFRAEEIDADYPTIRPPRILASVNLPGSTGRFNFDTRHYNRASTDPREPSYSLRVIPVAQTGSEQPVGRGSNSIDVYKDRAPPAGPDVLTESFQSQRFVDLVAERLDDRVSGYALAVIPFNGQPLYHSQGIARSDNDGSPRPMTVYDRVNVASVTKIVVAIAVVKALDANPSIDLDSTIADYLPADWELGTHVDTVTFRELLNHTSGLTSWKGLGIDNESLKKFVRQDIPDLSRKGIYDYANQNYGLLRILTPRIAPVLNVIAAQDNSGDGERLLHLVNTTVLAPAGIHWAAAEPDPGTALSFTFPVGQNKGRDWGATTANFGSSGLHVSAQELAQLMHAFARTENVVSRAQREAMTGDQLGGRALTDAGGRGFAKGGYLRSRPTDEPGSLPNNRAEQNTAVMLFSDGSVAALIVNSSYADSPSAPPNIPSILIDCFNQSYTPF